MAPKSTAIKKERKRIILFKVVRRAGIDEVKSLMFSSCKVPPVLKQ